MKPLNIAMIGYGGIGRVHALAYRAIPFHYGLPAGAVNIVGVATTRPVTAWEAGQDDGQSGFCARGLTWNKVHPMSFWPVLQAWRFRYQD